MCSRSIRTVNGVNEYVAVALPSLRGDFRSAPDRTLHVDHATDRIEIFDAKPEKLSGAKDTETS
jgi:hypothetical protein